jgi:Uma2 family endonuclease
MLKWRSCRPQIHESLFPNWPNGRTTSVGTSWAAIRVPPDLVVEVLSHGTEVHDRGRKMQIYERFGVPEYWIIDPVANAVEVHALSGGRYSRISVHDEHGEVRSATLPAFSFAAGRLFVA